ncbi:MAG: zinc metallopeptidase [Prevotellaceae bacterium]|jgi:Zn-dependent membrane protease YugP|nr:zinc metallopeptidase [Prevotellaceae bacterium]
MNNIYLGAYIIFGIVAILSYIVNSMLQNRFKKYSAIPLGNGMTGSDVAEKMLSDNGIANVTITSIRGELTDNYNPINRTLNLSDPVYGINSVAAAAVAAHECGHAIQHATAYRWLTMRTKLVPFVSFASRWMQWVLLSGILLIQVFPALMVAGIILFGITTLFSFITLPVEINASQRAVAWLERSRIVDSRTKPAAVDALKWAAYTYVIAALGSLATLVYYIMIFLSSQRRN